MVYIYILSLQCNKYYVGKTINPESRIENHIDSKGSAWTKKYKPISIAELIPDCDEMDEDKYTLKYMKEKGIENVRGGSFCERDLSVETVAIIEKMINASSDKCYLCGKVGHFAKKCKLRKRKTYKKKIEEKKEDKNDKNDNNHNNSDDSDDDDSDDNNDPININKDKDKDSDSDEKEEVVKKEIESESKKPQKIVCYICQKEGHYATKCFMRKRNKRN